MYGDIMKKQSKKKDPKKILFLILPLTALVLYILRLVSGMGNSDGVTYIIYTNNYPFILLGEYVLTVLLFFPFLTKADENGDDSVHIISLMFFAALGMMRIDSNTPITGLDADHAPAVMFLILFATLILMVFSKIPLTGAFGIAAGTLFYPAFGISFAPFIAAASFFCNGKDKSKGLIYGIINTAHCAAAAVYGIIKLEVCEFTFSKKYIPVLIAVIALMVFFAVKKDFSLLPVSLLPLFPLFAGIFFNAFPTPLFTLAASIAPLVITSGSLALRGSDKKIQGYAQALVHNPVCFIVIAAFILHTAAYGFYLPGHILDTYM